MVVPPSIVLVVLIVFPGSGFDSDRCYPHTDLFVDSG